MDLKTLDKQSVEQIHEASLTVLAGVGMAVRDEPLRRVLLAAGAMPAAQEQVVRLPREMVLSALRLAPHTVQLADRRGGSLLLAEGQPSHHCSSDFQRVTDFATAQVRRIRRQDIADLARLGDALPTIAGVCHQCLAEDVPEALAPLLSIEATVLNTSKHCLGAPVHVREAELWTEMAEVILGEQGSLAGTPIISFAISTTSPLQFDQESVNVLAYAARHGVPIVNIPCPMAGATTPFTLAGTLVVQNAENLFAVCLAQVVHPGASIVYGGIPGVMDMSTGSGLFGVPEFSLMLGAVAELARFYELPSYSALGDTDAAEIDAQCGAEKMLSYFAGYANGLNLSVGAGGVGTASIVSREQLIIDSDILQAVRRCGQGIQVDQETLALEAIARVGPGGEYLTDKHTLAWLRRAERTSPQAFNRQVYREGEVRANLLARAHQRAAQILAEHQPEVPAAVVNRVEAYVRDRVAELGMVNITCC